MNQQASTHLDFALRRLRNSPINPGWRIGAVMWWAWLSRLHDSTKPFCRAVDTPQCWRGKPGHDIRRPSWRGRPFKFPVST